jgi:hypothetical protein
MSNPSGTGPEDGASDTKDARAYAPAADTDPVTEVIELPAEAGLSASGQGLHDARRYTAPGFDAGYTQIIDRVPDDETEFITMPAQPYGSGSRVRRTGRRAIAPGAPQRPSWLIPILLLVAALLAAAIVGLVLFKRSEAKAARENAVRSTIESFDAAVRNGDLATLRDVTCGQTRQTYVNYDDAAWSDAYARVSAAKQYPVVASIDQVVVNGDHAEANVISYMAFDPGTTSVRSFDLQLRDGQWKICQSS